MTATQLREKFEREFGLSSKWPNTYEVDAETYANVCNIIFLYNKNDDTRIINSGKEDEVTFIRVAIGSHNQILFKNVELLLKS